MEKKVNLIEATITSILLITPVVFAAGDTVAATVEVLATCGIDAAPDIDFGALTENDISDEKSTTVSNSGNAGAVTVIDGTNWISGANSFPSEQTHFFATTSGTPYASMTPLPTTGSDPSAALGTIGPDGSLDVFFRVQIPDAQPVGEYSQTITFTSTC